ncbi:hypothetical protein ACFOLJ_26980 [Rugamonas sp. CCM 8940]|uniref:hypothetical protein n=1 Tax=Rugamonas sp. CCM 8940 TaxID=2765359 RepID=UPI0018F3F780|nr:hypothetical protein [Rugamonas sp. CCM 8940]MBJ7313598.1 hypothetical protein [Rugamonas sp. CCM 8940]
MSSHPLPGKKAAASRVALPYWLREFGRIRLATAALAGTLGIGAAAVFASQWHRDGALQAREQAQQTRDAAYTRFSQVETEKREIRAYQPRFLALRNKGLIGPGKRLDWIEAVRQVQERRKLLPLSYEIAPQQAFAAAPPMAAGDYQLRGSRMTLHMELLHEMDLFNFIDDLRQYALFTVQDCNIKRQAGAVNVATSAMLAADCTFNWLTLAPAEAAPAAGAQKGAP